MHSSDDGSEEEKRDGISDSEIRPMGDVDATMDDADTKSELQGRPSHDGQLDVIVRTQDKRKGMSSTTSDFYNPRVS